MAKKAELALQMKAEIERDVQVYDLAHIAPEQREIIETLVQQVTQMNMLSEQIKRENENLKRKINASPEHIKLKENKRKLKAVESKRQELAWECNGIYKALVMPKLKGKSGGGNG